VEKPHLAAPYYQSSTHKPAASLRDPHCTLSYPPARKIAPQPAPLLLVDNNASPAHASDATSKKGIFINLSRLLRQNEKLNLVLPYLTEDIAGHIEQSTTIAGSMRRDLSQGEIRGRVVKGRLGLVSGGKDFGFIFAKLIGRWLNEGKLKPDPYEFGR